MISYEQVQNSLKGYSPEQLGGLLGPALRGDFAMPRIGSRNEEPAEDFFARLLIAPETPKATRAAIVEACSRLYFELLRVAQVDGPAVHSEKDEETFLRLCRLINMAKPAELEFFVSAVLQTQLLVPNVPAAILGASVRAAMAYPTLGERLGLWDKLLLRPTLAAYGFQALLSLSVSREPSSAPHERIIRELVRLWVRRLADDWPTDSALLTLQASRQLQEEGIIDEVLVRLYRDHSHLWIGVVVELQRRSTTRAWLDRELLRREQTSGDIYSLIERMAVTLNASGVGKTKLVWDSNVFVSTKSCPRYWMLLSHDQLSEPIGKSVEYPRTLNLNETLTGDYEEPPRNWWIGIGAKSLRNRLVHNVTKRSVVPAFSRSQMRGQSNAELADDLSLSTQEASVVTFYSVMHFSGGASILYDPLHAPQQLMLNDVIKIEGMV